MKSKIEIALTEKEASHLRTLLEGGVTITDSITQSEIFYGILSKLSSQAQPEENEPEKVYVDPIVPNFTEELSAPVEYKTKKEAVVEIKNYLN